MLQAVPCFNGPGDLASFNYLAHDAENSIEKALKVVS